MIARLLLAVVLLLRIAGPADAATPSSCLPLPQSQLQCTRRLDEGSEAFGRALAKCRVKQAQAAYAARAFDAEHCTAAAGRKLRLSAYCDPALRSAAARAAADLARALDVDVNRRLFCEPSGAPLDPSGAVAGFVPATKPALACGVRIGTRAVKLVSGGLQCIGKSIVTAARGRTFDEAACQEAARNHYQRSAAKLPSRCPLCLATASAALFQEARALIDAERPTLTPCLTGYFFHAAGRLDDALPTATAPERILAPRLDPDETGTFPSWVSEPFDADTILDASALTVLHLGANQPMADCADIAVTVERIAGDQSRAIVGTALATGRTLSQASAKPLPPLGVDVALGDPTIPAGSRLAVTVAVTNRCRGNRGVSLEYDAAVAPSRLVAASPAPPSNDTCAQAFVVPVELVFDGAEQLRQTYVDVRDTRAATTDASDPAQTCSPGGAAQNARSVWYSYAALPPGIVGTLTVDTSTSSYDTVVTLHAGTCDDPTPLKCGLGGVTQTPLYTSVTGPFLIEVTDVSPAGLGGRLHLTLSFDIAF